MKIVQIQNAVFFIDEQMFEKKIYFFFKGNNFNSNEIALQRSELQTHITSEERSSQFSMNMFP